MLNRALNLRCVIWCLLLLASSRSGGAETPLPINTVFVILMENHNWDTIKGIVANCPYINNNLLPIASYCDQYYNPPGIHPSEPNYIWLEGGTNFGILDDLTSNRIPSASHLVTLLDLAGISWKSYQEDMGSNPLADQGNYRVRHNPMVLFNDVNGNTTYMTTHVRPYTELAGDLQNNTVARYNFITPNLTNDMHTLSPGSTSTRIQGDHWLSLEIPKILASRAYSNNGAIFITWDEGNGSSSDGPIGMIVISPLAKGGGYSNSNYYTHSSTLRTMQNIFRVRPYLGDAANATDLSDLFVATNAPPPRLTSLRIGNGLFGFTITNLIVGTTNYIQVSSNLSQWANLKTNVPTSTFTSFAEPKSSNFTGRFYRIKQAP